MNNGSPGRHSNPARNQKRCGVRQREERGTTTRTKTAIHAAWLLWMERQGLRPNPRGWAPIRIGKGVAE